MLSIYSAQGTQHLSSLGEDILLLTKTEQRIPNYMQFINAKH